MTPDITTIVTVLWWPIGFTAALLARYFVERSIDTMHILVGDRLSWGGLILCALAGLIMPLTVAAAISYGLVWIWVLLREAKYFAWLKNPIYERRTYHKKSVD